MEYKIRPCSVNSFPAALGNRRPLNQHNSAPQQLQNSNKTALLREGKTIFRSHIWTEGCGGGHIRQKCGSTVIIIIIIMIATRKENAEQSKTWLCLSWMCRRTVQLGGHKLPWTVFTTTAKQPPTMKMMMTTIMTTMATEFHRSFQTAEEAEQAKHINAARKWLRSELEATKNAQGTQQSHPKTHDGEAASPSVVQFWGGWCPKTDS